MDKKELQEVIHEEVNIPLSELASSFKKEKKKPNYVYLIVYSAFMLYILYILYKITKVIRL